MYNSELFLKYGQNYLKENINNKAIEEIKEIKELNRIKTKNSIGKKIELLNYYNLIQEEHLEKLTPMEADFIRLNIGTGSMEPMNYQELGETFDLTTSDVKNVLNRGIDKLFIYHQNKYKDN